MTGKEMIIYRGKAPMKNEEFFWDTADSGN